MKDAEVKKFLRAARQRFYAAEFLTTGGVGLNLDAIYLAGYAAECALKAVVLTNVPVPKRKAFKTTWFHGRRAHDLEHLRALARKLGVNIPTSLTPPFQAVIIWSTDLRYETGFKTTRETDDFLKAVKLILTWAERSG